MSKINAVRFINLNYNNNAMKINDECMQFSGKSTLLSLRNGGGKTVLVQMMTAPFVHRGKQKQRTDRLKAILQQRSLLLFWWSGCLMVERVMFLRD